jgi:hypothetical protein
VDNLNTTYHDIPDVRILIMSFKEMCGDEIQMASLDALPAKLKVILLWSMSSMNDLKALVCSSPSYHCAHLSRRHDILQPVLQDAIPKDLFFEAYAAFSGWKSWETLYSLSEVQESIPVFFRVRLFLSD